VASNLLPDPSTPFGVRVRARLRDDVVAWLTTVGDDGTPQPNPIWFLWEEAAETILIYNVPGAQRLRHVRRRPRVSLNFDGNGKGGDIVVVTGRAELATGEPLCHELPVYVAKYGERMKVVGGSIEGFSHAYPVALRVRPEKVRGF
jgi:PPOX class probable F420-dependent enzyme